LLLLLLKELEVKRFRLVQAMAKLEKTRVTANISGKVYSLKRVPGTYLNEGESVMTLTASDIHPWALARFTFKGALNISQGDAVDVYVPALGKHYQGTIQAMGHYALADSGSEAQSLEVSGSEVPVKIIFDKHPDDLSLGLGVEARVQTNFLNRLHAIITQWSSFEASI
jgi:multidrug resistance efflux pump